MFEETNQTEDKKIWEALDAAFGYGSEELPMVEGEVDNDFFGEEETNLAIEDLLLDEPLTSGATYKLKHLGEEKEVSLEEMISLAQKGLDYDFVKEQKKGLEDEMYILEGLARGRGTSREDLMGELGVSFMPQLPNVTMRADLKELASAFPALETLPQEVIAGIRAGKKPSIAYSQYLVEENKKEIERMQLENSNQNRYTGSMRSNASSNYDNFVNELFK